MLGGSRGEDVLQWILELSRQSALGEPAYPTIFDKVAVLLRFVPSMDGYCERPTTNCATARWTS